MQTRLLAVELADVLFRRSRVFRGLLAPRLAAFLVRASTLHPALGSVTQCGPWSLHKMKGPAGGPAWQHVWWRPTAEAHS